MDKDGEHDRIRIRLELQFADGHDAEEYSLSVTELRIHPDAARLLAEFQVGGPGRLVYMEQVH
jgi:hypothetical protein